LCLHGAGVVDAQTQITGVPPMKAVQELVAYFDRRQQLTPRQLRKLLDQGFLASDAPPTMVDLCDPVGATYYFRVLGAAEGQLWGTDIYTGDSALAVAAVHAGAVKAGESGIIKVTVMPPPQLYTGCVRHGVTSNDFGRFGTAYTIARM
jgi:LCCL domain